MANHAIDSTGLSTKHQELKEGLGEYAGALSIDLLDEKDVAIAQRMALIYVAITAFERSARAFVKRVLIDEFKGEWWEKGVSDQIRKFAESRRQDELKTKWHGDRGEDLLDYTELGHLPKIMQTNWTLFEAHVRRVDWATNIFTTIERSRNVIMHSGELDLDDADRVGMNIRDWTRQVGS